MIDFPDLEGYEEEVHEGSIVFLSDDIDFAIDHEEAVKKWIESSIADQEKTIEFIQYIFCSDEALLEINRDHLNHDYYTDIITFPYNSNPIEGEIYISIDRVRDNARSLELSFRHELFRVLIHGALHLCGYTDETPEEKDHMTDLENHYLELFNL